MSINTEMPRLNNGIYHEMATPGWQEQTVQKLVESTELEILNTLVGGTFSELVNNELVNNQRCGARKRSVSTEQRKNG
jgi:hypothetical protein